MSVTQIAAPVCLYKPLDIGGLHASSWTLAARSAQNSTASTRISLPRPAKALRPALCIATSLSLGGDLDAVLPSAAVLELFHNAFLIHGDVEDGSQLRRHAATLHRLHGTSIAINVGDAALERVRRGWGRSYDDRVRLIVVSGITRSPARTHLPAQRAHSEVLRR
jgi:geranylgeranyl pyrophosphate synthase